MHNNVFFAEIIIQTVKKSFCKLFLPMANTFFIVYMFNSTKTPTSVCHATAKTIVGASKYFSAVDSHIFKPPFVPIPKHLRLAID